MRKFRDRFGNRAEIMVRYGPAYKGDQEKCPHYVLSLYAEYDNDFMYSRSTYESGIDAVKALEGFSCGTFIAYD